MSEILVSACACDPVVAVRSRKVRSAKSLLLLPHPRLGHIRSHVTRALPVPSSLTDSGHRWPLFDQFLEASKRGPRLLATFCSRIADLDFS